MNDERQQHDEFVVHDGDREISFIGDKLAFVTSQKPGSQRWVELVLYRTAGGDYVLAGIGRSKITGEVDRRWTQVSTKPQGVIERLYMIDNNGAKYLPNTSRYLLEQAAKLDSEIHNEFYNEFIN